MTALPAPWLVARFIDPLAEFLKLPTRGMIAPSSPGP